MNVRRPEVVVGVDGSAESRAALRWAVGHARRTGGRVTAVAVSELRPLLAPGAGLAGGGAAGAGMLAGTVPGGYYGAADDDTATAEAELWLSEAVRALPPEAAEVIDSRVERGDAAETLLAAARGAELLVLGNHGRGALSGALVASVAQHCVRHAAGPLVLVPAPDPAVADAG
jgi:nucleotide-binding universal stress UspA family protein